METPFLDSKFHQHLERSCPIVSDLFRTCRTCFGLVLDLLSTCRTCIGLASDLFRTCFGLAFDLPDLYRTCFGLVSDLLWTCFGLVSDLLWTCFGLVLDLFEVSNMRNDSPIGMHVTWHRLWSIWERDHRMFRTWTCRTMFSTWFVLVYILLRTGRTCEKLATWVYNLENMFEDSTIGFQMTNYVIHL